MSFSDSKEEGFAPNHYCVHHGGVEHGGQIVQAEAISHNWSEELQKVTAYNMRLPNGVILEAVPAEDILVTKASLVNEHAGHPVPKRDTPKQKIRMALKENKRYSDYDNDKGRMDSWRKYLTEAAYQDFDAPCNDPQGDCPDHDSNEAQLDEGGFVDAAEEIEKKGTEGEFTKYCGGKVTDACIEKGLKAGGKRAKQAAFAKAARTVAKENK
jgi:hypothetical protein|tara:strand:- start:614 stop:1249 length:636 start_codon:yes stop_codon:yes gene_type:complete